jgi:hypothetical protein
LITFASVAVAVIAACAAVWSCYEAHETRVEDERPYILTEFAGFKAESTHDLAPPNSKAIETSSLTPHIKLDVFGKAPAIEVIVLSSCSYSTGADLQTERQSEIEGVGFIFPAENRTISCKPARKPYSSVKIFGVVSYTDVHHGDYKTPYCFNAKVGEEDKATPCPANDVR